MRELQNCEQGQLALQTIIEPATSRIRRWRAMRSSWNSSDSLSSKGELPHFLQRRNEGLFSQLASDSPVEHKYICNKNNSAEICYLFWQINLYQANLLRKRTKKCRIILYSVSFFHGSKYVENLRKSTIGVESASNRNEKRGVPWG
jgi:hypothetical protein